jgi:hypothetical protein
MRDDVCVLAHGAAPRGPEMVDRKPPGHADEPGAEALSISKLPEPPMGPDECLLRDVLRILAMAKDRERDAECQRRRLGQPALELAFELIVHAQQPGKSLGALVHRLTSARRRARCHGSLRARQSA